MTWLLVTNYEKEPAQWQRDLRQHVKDIEIRGFSDEYDPAMIEVILTDCPLQSRGGFGLFTNLKWVHFLGHGVGDVLHDPSLRTGIIVTRQHQQSTADSLAIYALHAVTNHHLRAHDYWALKLRACWQRLPLARSNELKIVVLGLGIIGRTIAIRLSMMGYSVTGWSRTKHTLPGVNSVFGSPALHSELETADYVIGALPETNQTINLINISLIMKMKKGVYIINIGRGSLINEKDLLAAIDIGHISGAHLDVFSQEPLPNENPLWSHPNVTITPHQGGPPQADTHQIIEELAQNYRRLRRGNSLLHVANRKLGY